MAGIGGSPEQPWSEQEKMYLLCEIIKAANIPLGSQKLLHFIFENSISPSWEDIPLPSGRSLNSCTRTFREISGGTYFDPNSHRTPQLAKPAEPCPPNSLKRPFSATELSTTATTATTTGQRVLQPRPPGETFYNPPGEYVLKAKRKRGRPSNAELKAKREYYESIGQPYPEPKRQIRMKKSDMDSSKLGDGSIAAGTQTPPVAQSTVRPTLFSGLMSSTSPSSDERRSSLTRQNHDRVGEKLGYLEGSTEFAPSTTPQMSAQPKPSSEPIPHAQRVANVTQGRSPNIGRMHLHPDENPPAGITAPLQYSQRRPSSMHER